MTLAELLAHQHAREVAARIANGDNPKSIAATLAGNIIAEQVARVIGAPKQEKSNVTIRVEKKKQPDVVDAEFVEL